MAFGGVRDFVVDELFAVEIAAMRDRASVVEVEARFARGLMTAGEVLGAAWRASRGRLDLCAELACQFRASQDESIRWIGDWLDEATRRES